MDQYQKKGSAGALIQRAAENIPQLAAQRQLQQHPQQQAAQMMYPNQYGPAGGYYMPEQMHPHRMPVARPMHRQPMLPDMQQGDRDSAIMRELQALRQMMRPQGGPVHYADYEHGISAYAAPIDISKGGILQSPVLAVPASSAVGFSVSATVAGLNLARLTGTIWQLCASNTTGLLADPEEASKLQINCTINGRPVNNLFDIPLDATIPNLMGNAAMIPIRTMVMSDAIVTFTVTVVTAALSSGAASTVVFRLYAGDDSQWAHLVHNAR